MPRHKMPYNTVLATEIQDIYRRGGGGGHGDIGTWESLLFFSW